MAAKVPPLMPRAQAALGRGIGAGRLGRQRAATGNGLVGSNIRKLAFNVQKDGQPIPVTFRLLERLGLYRVTTPSPFEKGQLTFEGVLVRDVLKLVGLEDKDWVTLRGIAPAGTAAGQERATGASWRPLFVTDRRLLRSLLQKTVHAVNAADKSMPGI
ncbi:hypothetical protein EOD23_00830 [Mesorhizobium sp. USDA-HM6]|nr:hypothetical protein EOD23_00830 [Mesorhizobium sp. USDA-HM6]